MNAKLLAGVALPLLLTSSDAMAFGVLGLIGGIAGATIGAAGGATLSASGVGPAGRPGATAFSPGAGIGTAVRAAWATTASSDLPGLMPSGTRGVPQSAIRVKDLGWVYGHAETLRSLSTPLRRRSGVDRRTVGLCRDALARKVAAHGATQVEVASAGRSLRRSGATFSPLTARIVYRLPTNYEVRQATVTCRTDTAGRTVLVY